MPSVSRLVFCPDLDRTFFLSPDWPKIRMRSGKIRIRIRKKVQKLQQQVEKICISYLAISTLSFFQVPPKPNQKHHLDPISLLMDGSGSG